MITIHQWCAIIGCFIARLPSYLCGDGERDLWVTLQLLENGITVMLWSARYRIYQDKSLRVLRHLLV